MARVRLANWFRGSAPGAVVDVADGEVPGLLHDGRVAEVLGDERSATPAVPASSESPAEPAQSEEQQEGPAQAAKTRRRKSDEG